MSDGEGKPVRRLRLIPSRQPQPPAEPPRVEALDALLHDIDELRLRLETDLTLAASAVEAGSPQLAADILDDDRRALHGFEDQARGHLAELETPARRRSLWSQAHAGAIVAAAALVGVLAGVVPHVISQPDRPTETVAASDSLERLQQYAEQGDPAQVRAASVALHEQLAGVVSIAKTDPAAAQNALLLLSFEQRAIVGSGDSSALADVLRQSQALARAIVAALPPAARKDATVQSVPGAAQPSESPKPKPKPSPTATQKAQASPKPSPSPSPSPTKSDGYPLPSPPIAP